MSGERKLTIEEIEDRYKKFNTPVWYEAAIRFLLDKVGEWHQLAKDLSHQNYSLPQTPMSMGRMKRAAEKEVEKQTAAIDRLKEDANNPESHEKVFGCMAKCEKCGKPLDYRFRNPAEPYKAWDCCCGVIYEYENVPDPVRTFSIHDELTAEACWDKLQKALDDLDGAKGELRKWQKATWARGTSRHREGVLKSLADKENAEHRIWLWSRKLRKAQDNKAGGQP